MLQVFSRLNATDILVLIRKEVHVFSFAHLYIQKDLNIDRKLRKLWSLIPKKY